MKLPEIEWEEPPLVRLYHLGPEFQYTVTAATEGREVYHWEWHPRRKRYRKSVHRAYRTLGVFP